MDDRELIDDDDRAARYLGEMTLMLRRVSAKMAEAHREGLEIGFQFGPAPDYSIAVLQITKTWKAP